MTKPISMRESVPDSQRPAAVGQGILDSYFFGLFHFYRDGFRAMRTGKTLWRIILLKIAVFLLILKLFFPDYLQTHFRNDRQRADHVLTNLTDPVNSFNSGGR